jgi:hypothetical protein
MFGRGHPTLAEREESREGEGQPEEYIAQPTLGLSAPP